MQVNTREITITGLLSAMTVVMGATKLGFVPVPTPAGAATLMHLPVILAGIVQGPAAGVLTGLIFGLFSLQYLPDLRVVIPARLLIGPAAWAIYHALGRSPWAVAAASACGSIVNTVGTLALAVAFNYIPAAGKGGALAIAGMQGVPEAIVAAVIVTPIVAAVQRSHR